MRKLIIRCECWMVLHSSWTRMLVHRVTRTRTGDAKECAW